MLALSMGLLAITIFLVMLLVSGRQQNAFYWGTLLALNTLSLFAQLAFG